MTQNLGKALDEDQSDDLDLATLWHVAWRSRYIIIVATILGAGIAIALAFIATPHYIAEITISEVRDTRMGGSSSVSSSELGGLASLAGVALGGGADPTREARALLNSRRLLEEFITRNNLLPVLFQNSDLPPSMWFGIKYFKDHVINIREDTRKGLYTIEIEWTDAQVAADWANGLAALLNEMIRKKAQAESQRNVDYLNKQIAQTNVLELQRVMYKLIETETKTLMLANGRADYAYSVLDRAVPPELRSSPKRTLMAIGGTAIGFFLGIVGAFLYEVSGKRRRSAATGA
ncbi:MAG: Wzz/FepE/Etk N-terminal domain-containing protein [Steroidobacteraceae bacterium]